MTIAPETSEVPGESSDTLAGIGARELLIMISAIMALMALAIDLLLPAFDDIGETFGLDPDANQAAQTITVFFLGLAIAQLVGVHLLTGLDAKPVLLRGHHHLCGWSAWGRILSYLRLAAHSRLSGVSVLQGPA